ncbi:MAG: translation initiation factor IF-5A [Candidatus Pacearchaeota archaeon]
MSLKLVDATELRQGSFAMINEAPCVVKSIDISKTGKHGASKCRIEAIGILDDKKRITVMPGSERVAVPMIEKKRAQVLSINKQDAKASVMDLENFETIDAAIASDLLESVAEGSQVEYWNVEGSKIIKRLL